MSSLKFIFGRDKTCGDYVDCCRRRDCFKKDERPEKRGIFETILNKSGDMDLAKLAMDIAAAVQLTSALLRKASISYVREFMDCSVYPVWPDELFVTKINDAFLAQLMKNKAVYVVSSPLYDEPIEAVERWVKEVSEASKHVFGAESRDGCIRARLLDRALNPVFESNKDFKAVNAESGRFVVVFCGIDGPTKSHITRAMSSTFGIYDKIRDDDGKPANIYEQVLQRGKAMLLSGYAIYGSTTTLQMAFRKKPGGAICFILSSYGEFLLTDDDYVMPWNETLYSVDEGGCLYYTQAFLEYLEALKNPRTGPLRAFSRYCGSVVADIHQVFIFGGIYILPTSTRKQPTLEPWLVHQILPVSFVASRAGGLAVTTSTEPLLELKPPHLDSTTTFLVGSYRNMTDFLRPGDLQHFSHPI